MSIRMHRIFAAPYFVQRTVVLLSLAPVFLLAAGCLRRAEATPPTEKGVAAVAAHQARGEANAQREARGGAGVRGESPRTQEADAQGEAGSYKPEAGPFRVGMADFELRDEKRDKTLPIRVRWPIGPKGPAAALSKSDSRPPGTGGRGLDERPASAPAEGSGESFALVVFSHGAGGSSDAFGELSEHWASHGYVVVHPTHSDSVKLRRAAGERIEDFRNAANQIVRKVRPEERVGDIGLVLDRINEIEKLIAASGPRASTGSSASSERDRDRSEPGENEPRVDRTPQDGIARIRIDRDRIAVAGHSAGAFTTQMIAGLRFTGRGRMLAKRDFRDPRVKAAIVISGQGLSRPALAKGSWAEMKLPMMVYAGSEDRSPVSDETPTGRRHPFVHAPAGDKYLVFIEGATHGSYQGKEAVRVLRERQPDNLGYITELVAFGTLAFLDAHLQNQAEALHYLTSDAISAYPGGRVEFRRK